MTPVLIENQQGRARVRQIRKRCRRLSEGAKLQALCAKAPFADAPLMLVKKTRTGKTFMPPFCRSVNLNNPLMSQSRRKMDGIALQGDLQEHLQEHLSVERVERLFNEYRSGAGKGGALPRNIRIVLDAGLR